MDLVLQFLRYSDVLKFRFLEMVIRNGSLLINMMSVHNVMDLYCLSSSGGAVIFVMGTCCDWDRTVFPFKLPRFGPNLSSAVLASYWLKGQFRICLHSMILRNVLVDSRPMQLSCCLCLVVVSISKFRSVFLYRLDKNCIVVHFYVQIM